MHSGARANLPRLRRIGTVRGLAAGSLAAAFFLFPGCAKSNTDLERINREQSATIRSLNREIGRLNAELEELVDNRKDLLGAKSAFEKNMGGELASGDLTLSMQDRGLVVTVLDRVLFDSGRAELKPSAQETLNKVAEILNEKIRDNVVYIEGHTDNVPIGASGWRSNWELSTARATEVIHYFVDINNLNPERLAATGYGEFHPVAPNDSPEGRMKNRRVEIVVSPKKVGG